MDTSNASLQDFPLDNGATIICADCHYLASSYDILVQHISLSHPPESLAQYLASQPGRDGTPLNHPMANFRVEGERLPNTYEAFEHDKYSTERSDNPSYPFVDLAEVQLARWMNDRLPSTAIDEFLKLEWVSFSQCPANYQLIFTVGSSPQSLLFF